MNNPKVCAFLLAGVFFLAGCGAGPDSGASPPPPQAGTAPLSIVVRDAPPAGVTLLSFEVTLTGAVLQPGNVSVVSSPIRVELRRLEFQSAFLATVNVPAGTYTSVTVTFANPELTFLNNTGATLLGCAPGEVCKVTPPVNQSAVTFSGAPFPLTISPNSPVGLLLDFDLGASIQLNLSVTPNISFQLLPPLAPTGALDELEDLIGRVVSVDAANNRFTLQLTITGQTLTVEVNAQTRFDDFDDAGLANAPAGLAAGQNVEVDLRLMPGGTFLARRVKLRFPVNEEELEGIVISVDVPGRAFRMVVLEEVPASVAGISIGTVVSVTLENSVNFRVDEDGLTVPPDLMFASEADLLAGQMVQVRRRSGSAGTAVVTDRVRLRRTRLAAEVSAPGAVNFQVSNLSSLFTAQGITQIEVRTSGDTGFDGVPNAASLVVGNRVALRGLLFRTPGNPVLVAKKVRRR